MVPSSRPSSYKLQDRLVEAGLKGGFSLEPEGTRTGLSWSGTNSRCSVSHRGRTRSPHSPCTPRLAADRTAFVTDPVGVPRSRATLASAVRGAGPRAGGSAGLQPVLHGSVDGSPAAQARSSRGSLSYRRG